MPGDADVGAAVWPTRRPGVLLLPDGRIDRVQLRLCVLSIVRCAHRVRGGLFFVGVGGGSFAVYWAWISEQYRTECRGSALAFATSIGRFVAAGATFLVGIGIQRYGSIGMPVALTAIPFVLGLMLLPLAIETRGKPLPL